MIDVRLFVDQGIALDPAYFTGFWGTKFPKPIKSDYRQPFSEIDSTQLKCTLITLNPLKGLHHRFAGLLGSR